MNEEPGNQIALNMDGGISNNDLFFDPEAQDNFDGFMNTEETQG